MHCLKNVGIVGFLSPNCLLAVKLCCVANQSKYIGEGWKEVVTCVNVSVVQKQDTFSFYCS